MLKLRDLDDRKYLGKSCVSFSYVLRNEKNEPINIFRFEKSLTEPTEWVMNVIIGRTRDADSQVYKFDYMMPRENLPLELIAATGLKYFQLYLKEEIQMKMNYDFTLGEVLKGM